MDNESLSCTVRDTWRNLSKCINVQFYDYYINNLRSSIPFDVASCLHPWFKKLGCLNLIMDNEKNTTIKIEYAERWRRQAPDSSWKKFYRKLLREIKQSVNLIGCFIDVQPVKTFERTLWSIATKFPLYNHITATSTGSTQHNQLIRRDRRFEELDIIEAICDDKDRDDRAELPIPQ